MNELYSLAHKSDFAGHVIVTTGLRRMHFPRPGNFLRWNSNLQQVDFSQSFASNNILGQVVLAVNDGFLHLYVRSVTYFSVFLCLHFCNLPFGNSSIIIIFFEVSKLKESQLSKYKQSKMRCKLEVDWQARWCIPRCLPCYIN